LKDRTGKNGILIPNAMEIERYPAGKSEKEYVLWIGKADDVKRPQVVRDLAEAASDIKFVMVMNQSIPSVWASVVDRVPSNLRLIERVSFAESEKLFERAIVLLNTSRFEGFPNTFLQAGRLGVPILSLSVDPDEFIVRTGSGAVCSNDTTLLLPALLRFCRDSSYWSSCSLAVRSYMERNHEIGMHIPKLEAAFFGMRQV
jgi:hypothetical protein